MLSRLLVSGVFGFLVSACATPSPRDEVFGACAPGGECSLTGTLTFHAGQPPAWIAHLEAGGKCAKLALPDDFYENEQLRRRWSGKKVIATGDALSQPRFDESDGQATLWYEEGDRKIAMGMCDQGVVIFVQEMRSGPGMTWVSP